MQRSSTFWIAALLLIGAAPLAAFDDPPGSDVKVSVVAILASEDGQIDPRLKDIAKEIKKSSEIKKRQPPLTGFRLAKMTCKSVAVRGSESFELVADQQATVTVMKAADKDNHVQLKISPPTVGEITFTVVCGKFFPIITNYQTSNRELLIIAVRVQPCKK
jgi:hypothetical protein